MTMSIRRVGKMVGLATTLLIAIVGVATTMRAAPAVPAPQSAVYFTVFAAAKMPDLIYSPAAESEPVILRFYPTARSPHYEYRGPMPLVFLDSKTGAQIAAVEIPKGVSDALLLFVDDSAGSPKRYRVYVLDDSSERREPGRLALVNFSGIALSGTANGREFVLRAGLNPGIEIGRSAMIALRTSLRGRTYQAYTGTVELASDERALLILFPPFYPGSVEVQSRLLVDKPSTSQPKSN